MKRAIAPFVSGVLFALGLGLSGMTKPEKVLAFLDVTGHWDPSLMFVMGGAVLFGLVAFASILRRGRTVAGTRFHLPTETGIDRKLLAGAALFGVGWGLSGYCPGPAIVSVVTGAPHALLFVVAMLAGMALFELRFAPTRAPHLALEPATRAAGE